jgi:hypothetical protein
MSLAVLQLGLGLLWHEADTIARGVCEDSDGNLSYYRDNPSGFVVVKVVMGAIALGITGFGIIGLLYGE